MDYLTTTIDGLSMEADREKALAAAFEADPGTFPSEHRDAIVRGQVIVGMSPYEAHCAAGAFSFRVIADPGKWKPGTPPISVLWSQSKSPDDSQISMTFCNSTQFGTMTQFVVEFAKGRASRIGQSSPAPSGPLS